MRPHFQTILDVSAQQLKLCLGTMKMLDKRDW